MSNEEDLIQILNAHGRSFLKAFGEVPVAGPSKKRRTEPIQETLTPEVSEEEEDWAGIDHDASELSDENDFGNSGYDHDDDFVVDSSQFSNIVVFRDTSSSSSNMTYDPAMKKAFMSSKVSKIKQDDGAGDSPLSKSADPNADDDERTNTQNDAILHRLVHTKLLSGSLNADLDLKPAERKKALAGRILELAGTAKLGKGEKSVWQAERNKHAKRVRTGLLDKEKERQHAHVEEAKNMGNYHRSLKRVFEDPDDASKRKRERERGLRMGVGKFSGGMLKLSQDEIQRVNDSGPRGGRGGGRGRGRGRGGERGQGQDRGRGLGRGRGRRGH